MAAKMRSPNYPALSLPQAIDVVSKLWSVEKRTAVSNLAAAEAMGFKSLSGPARVAIGAMRQFGLIDKAETGHIRVSDLAVNVLHGHGDAHRQALVTAAINPDLFDELQKTHGEASENAIRSYLITKKGFAEDGARKAAKAFLDTMALAAPAESGYTAVGTQDKPEAIVDTTAVQGASGKGSDVPGVMTLKVPYGAGSLAVDIRVTGERLTRSHIEKICRYLELAKDDLPTENAD